MATKLRIEFKSQGFREILCNDATDSVVQSEANKIANKAKAMAHADAEFGAKTFRGGYGGGRRIGIVSTDNYMAMRDEATDKVLSKAVM